MRSATSPVYNNLNVKIVFTIGKLLLEASFSASLAINSYNKKIQYLICKNITRPNCALDRRTILCLYVPGFHRQVFKPVEILSERSKESKEQKKNKGSVLVAESAFNARNAQFGLVMKFKKNILKAIVVNFAHRLKFLSSSCYYNEHKTMEVRNIEIKMLSELHVLLAQQPAILF